MASPAPDKRGPADLPPRDLLTVTQALDDAIGGMWVTLAIAPVIDDLRAALDRLPVRLVELDDLLDDDLHRVIRVLPDRLRHLETAWDALQALLTSRGGR